MSHKCSVHGCNEPVAADKLCWAHWEMLITLEARPDYVDHETAMFEIEHQPEGWPREPLIMSLQDENERATMEGLGWRLNWVSLADGTEQWAPPQQ